MPTDSTLLAPILEAQGLTRRVPLGDEVLTILNDVSFRLYPGQSLAIVGASGSGKSTLLGLLAGLDEASDGIVTIGKDCLQALDEDGRAKVRADYIGFVFQSFQLLPALTALDNVALPLELRGDAKADEAARTILQRVGLGDRLHHTPARLSGGEQQRVAIARAFVTEPKLLLADEPTGNLDTETGNTIIELLFDLNQATGTTLVLVTHDETLAQRCHCRLHLSGGKVIKREGC